MSQGGQFPLSLDTYVLSVVDRYDRRYPPTRSSPFDQALISRKN